MDIDKEILFVDDEKDFTVLASTLLEFHDFSVDTVNQPEQVMGMLRKKKYALIVTDIMMPGLNGFELIKKIREDQNYKKTPIVVLSARNLSDEERKILMQNEAHYLMKPFEPQGLVDQINSLLRDE